MLLAEGHSKVALNASILVNNTATTAGGALQARENTQVGRIWVQYLYIRISVMGVHFAHGTALMLLFDVLHPSRHESLG